MSSEVDQNDMDSWFSGFFADWPGRSEDFGSYIPGKFCILEGIL